MYIYIYIYYNMYNNVIHRYVIRYSNCTLFVNKFEFECILLESI